MKNTKRILACLLVLALMASLTVSAFAVNVYDVTFDCDHITAVGSETAAEGADYTAAFTAEEGFELPETIVVSVDEAVLTAETDYTYSQTGELTVYAAAVTGNITVSAAGVPVSTAEEPDEAAEPEASEDDNSEPETAEPETAEPEPVEPNADAADTAPDVSALVAAGNYVKITSLPYSSTYTLGSEAPIMTDYHDETYGKVYEIAVKAGEIVTFKFGDASIDAFLEVYYVGEGGVLEYSEFIDDDPSDDMETAVLAPSADTTYYVAACSYSTVWTGTAAVSAETFLYISFDTWVQSSESITLPYKGSYTIGSEKAFKFYDDYYYGKLYSVELNAGDVIVVKASGRMDIGLGDIGSDEDGYYYNDFMDAMPLNGEEVMYITAPSSGTYYFSVEGSYLSDTGDAKVSVYKVSATGTLDFTAAVPPEGSSWTWDAASKTLTLKDGFHLAAASEEGILLPENATVIVEGEAGLDCGKDAIVGAGRVNIFINKNASLSIKSRTNGISCDGYITVEGADRTSNISITASSYAYLSNNVGYGSSIMLKNLDAYTYDGLGAIMSDGSIEIENVQGSFTSANIITSLNGDVLIRDSDINCHGQFWSSTCIALQGKNIDFENSYVVLYAEDAIKGETVTIKESEVIAMGEETAVAASSIEVLNSYCNFTGDYLLDVDDINISQDVVLLSRGSNGFEEVYMGPWSDGFVTDDGSVRSFDGKAITEMFIVKDSNGAACKVEGMEESYAKGDGAAFKASGDDVNNSRAYDRYYTPVSWSIIGETDLSGGFVFDGEMFTAGSAEFSTEDLVPGVYTLKVDFVKSYINIYGEEIALKDGNGQPIIRTVVVNFEVMGDKVAGNGKPVTGDGENVMLWLGIAAAASVGTVLVMRRRKED